MSLIIRPGVVEDAESIARFQIAMALETENKALDPAIVNAAVSAVFENSTRGFYVVAQQDGEVVASLLITYEWSDWRNCDMWYIQSLFVEKEHRGQGVFKKMYQRVVELAKQQDVLFVRLYVEVDNVPAQKIYESLGMKRMPYYMYDVRI